MKSNAKKNVRLLILCVVLLAVIYVILKYVGVPIPIKKEVTASQIVIGETEITPVNVKIDGWLRIFIGSGNSFEGELEIESYEETKDTDATALGTGMDDVYILMHKKAGEDSFGLLVSDSLFWKNFAIQVTEGTMFTDGKTAILYPEVTADTMDERIEEIRRTVGWSEQLLAEEETKGE